LPVEIFAKGSRSTGIDEQLSDGASSIRRENAFQQPSLFDFRKQKTPIYLLR